MVKAPEVVLCAPDVNGYVIPPAPVWSALQAHAVPLHLGIWVAVQPLGKAVVWMVASANLNPPVARAMPLTSSVAVGLAVPMPTLPLFRTVILPTNVPVSSRR